MLTFYVRLRKEYRLCNEKLGQTGAGLRYEDIQEGSDLKNLVGKYKLFYHIPFNPQHPVLEQLEQDYPYWRRLHGFWRTLPNFNPYTASSEPGQDLAGQARALIENRGTHRDNEDGEAFRVPELPRAATSVDVEGGMGFVRFSFLFLTIIYV